MKLRLLLGTLLFTAVTANAQLATINEDFQTFTAGNTAAWPQNNWSNIQNTTSGPWVYVAGTTNKLIQYYSFSAANTAGYLITPQIIAPDGSKTLTFNAALTTGSASGATGTIEVGLVDNPTDMGTFTSIGNIINLTAGNVQYSLPVPASSKQYIAFKIIGSNMHTAIQVDDVVYNTTSSLGVKEHGISKDDVKFTMNADHTSLVFITKKQIKNVQIYSASGQKVAEGKPNGGQFAINSLQEGVYYTSIETEEGTVIPSKFIKK
ncbi:T9SS type A sorting domain-containing protein [Chryseobacterium indologenes]|uniref:T9SS type A sorting domain-containing protein n=1 Tax=Chryseobacterium indologenes TaxID=253 RepID=UPI0023E8D8C5|nr:T9SS type A sorting domain-containing protein [Chryseobacterium indologenes]WET49446.1 T9SS type A sorting domain-containing protein [Chryseobacterium indologenes]